MVIGLCVCCNFFLLFNLGVVDLDALAGLDALTGRAGLLQLNLLGGLGGLLDVAAHLGEVDSGVVEGEEERCDEDEGAVEDEEAGLVLHDFVAPTASHFSDTIK